MSKHARHKILFLIPTLYGGGSERVVVNLLRNLDRNKFQICLCVIDMRGAVYRNDIPADVETIDLGFSRIRYAVPYIIWMIWKRRPDIVFSLLGQLNLTLGMLRPILPPGIRYLARESVVVSELLKNMRLARVLSAAYRIFYRRFNIVICQSEDMRNDFINNFSLEPEKLSVIPNPVDIERIRMLASEPVETGIIKSSGNTPDIINLVAAGRLVHQKGFDLLINAIASCADVRYRLTILGEGPLRIELEQYALALGIAKQIRFVGFQSNPYPFISQADVFVLSSRFEGFPNVVLEALACGTPVVATPAPGGVNEILDRIEDCRIASRIDSDSLAEALAASVPGKRLLVDAASPYQAKVITRHYEKLLS